jgi:hypothetical protein
LEINLIEGVWVDQDQKKFFVKNGYFSKEAFKKIYSYSIASTKKREID